MKHCISSSFTKWLEIIPPRSAVEIKQLIKEGENEGKEEANNLISNKPGNKYFSQFQTQNSKQNLINLNSKFSVHKGLNSENQNNKNYYKSLLSTHLKLNSSCDKLPISKATEEIRKINTAVDCYATKTNSKFSLQTPSKHTSSIELRNYNMKPFLLNQCNSLSYFKSFKNQSNLLNQLNIAANKNRSQI